MTFDFGFLNSGRESIRVLEGLQYFAKGGTQSLGAETMPEPWADEIMVFEDLFNLGLRMPPHPMLMDVLQKLRVQLHQLMPNDVSKFI
jgi:hypothetical protein